MKQSVESVLLQALERSAHEFVTLSVSQHQSRADKFVLKSLLSRCSPQSAAQICDALASITTVALDGYRNCREQGEEHVLAPKETASSPARHRQDESVVQDHADSPQAGSSLPAKMQPATRSRRAAQERKKAADVAGDASTSGNESLERDESVRTKLKDQLGELLKTLQGCALLANLALTEATDVMQPSWLFPIVLSFHEAIILLEAEPSLQDSIATLCEFWWRESLEGRESLIVQSFPFLLSKALAWGRKKDIQRVYGMRSALALFDFFDESIEDMKHLLLRTVVTPSFLRCQPGRRFISFLFGVDPQLVRELVVIVRSQIPFGRKSMLEAYGETLYQAWKGAEGACLHEIEHCIQGLFEGSLYASSKSLGAAVRTMLEVFAAQKANDGVEAMLFRLLEPLLFRALQVANSNVRQNALLAWVDVFPLEDPDGSKEEKEALLEKQFGLLEKVLIDPCPDVRSVAAEVVCRILRLFWEIIPSSVTVKFLNKLVNDLAKDSTSNSVRLAVLKGITYLLENPQSHALLKAVLPRLGHVLNDICLSVRVAAVELLLVIKGIRFIKFYKVVRLDSLLSSLATDQPLVAQRLTRLLIPTYFSQKVLVTEACKRCLVLLKRSPQAGSQFCKWLFAEGVSGKSLLELVRILSCSAREDDELTEEVRTGILLALSEVCQTLATNGEWRAAIAEILTGDVLAALISCAPDSLGRSYVLQIASRLPPNHVSKLVNYCVDLVTKSPDTPADLAEVWAVHALVLSWGGLDNLLEALVDLLSGGTGVSTSRTVKGRAPSCRPKLGIKRAQSASAYVSNGAQQSEASKRTVVDKFVAAAGAAWQVETLLGGDETRLALLRSSRLKELMGPLRSLSQIAIEWAGHGPIVSSTMCSAASPILVYMKLYAHIVLEAGGKSELALNTSTKRCKRQPKTSDLTTGALADISGGFEVAWEELVFWLREMLAEATTTGNFISSTPSSQHKPKHAHCSKRKLRQREPLSPLSGNIAPVAKSKVNDKEVKDIDSIVTVLATILQTIADSFSLGLITSLSVRQTTAHFVSDSIQFLTESFFRSNQSEDKGLKAYWASAKVVLSYAAKFLHLYLKDEENKMEEGCMLAHHFLDLIAVVESQKVPKIPIPLVVSTLQQWIPDMLIAICTSVVDIEGPSGLSSHSPVKDTSGESTGCLEQFRPWLSHIADCAYEAMALEQSQNPETSASNPESSGGKSSPNCLNISSECSSDDGIQTNARDLMKTIVYFLRRGNVQVLSDFVHILIRFAVSSFGQRNYRATVGSLELVCGRLLMCRVPGREGHLVLRGPSVMRLTEMSDQVNTVLKSSSPSHNHVFPRAQMEVVHELLRIILSCHGNDIL